MVFNVVFQMLILVVCFCVIQQNIAMRALLKANGHYTWVDYILDRLMVVMAFWNCVLLAIPLVAFMTADLSSVPTQNSEGTIRLVLSWWGVGMSLLISTGMTALMCYPYAWFERALFCSFDLTRRKIIRK